MSRTVFISLLPSESMSCHRFDHPDNCLSKKPSGLPSFDRSAASTSTVCNFAIAATMAVVKRSSARSKGLKQSRSSVRTTTPRFRSSNTKGAPIMLSSSQNRYALGASLKTLYNFDKTRYSRFISCAPGAILPKGGLRKIISVDGKVSR